MLNRITNNWNLKLMALVLAVALWSHVRGEVNPWETGTFKVRLPHDPPPRMILVNDTKLPATVEVTVRAPRQTLREIKGNTLANPLAPVEVTPSVSGNQIRVQMDFSKARRGEQTVPIKTILNVADAEVIGTNPPDVDVVLDQATSTRIAVEAEFAVAANAGYRVANVTVAPEVVDLSGPSNALSRVAKVQARAKIEQLVTGVERTLRVPIVALDADGQVINGINLEPSSVQVAGTLLENRVTRRIRVAPGWRGSPAAGYRVTDIEIMPSRITVRGPQSILEKMASLSAPIDLEGATADMSRRVNVLLPPGVKTIDVKQVLVKVQIARPGDTDQSPASNSKAEQKLPLERPVRAGQPQDSSSLSEDTTDANLPERTPSDSGEALPPPALSP